jgi:hypothetical protein
MTEARQLYENLVIEEDELVAKIQLCEGCQWTILEYLIQHGELGRGIGEEITTTIHTIEQDLRTELLHLRLDKGFLAAQL